MVTSEIRAIMGLGNPGPEYQLTRHNAGALWVEWLARKAGIELRPDKRFHGLFGRVDQPTPCYLLIPTTFMNRSGMAAAALSQYFKLSPESVLVAHDELDLPTGSIRLKRGGGHGGHNGLKDIAKALGTPEFPRVRFGIGHPGSRERVLGHVLGRLGNAEQEVLNGVFQALDAELSPLLAGRWDRSMGRLHSLRVDP